MKINIQNPKSRFKDLGLWLAVVLLLVGKSAYAPTKTIEGVG